MNNEKVKEIKTKLQEEIFIATKFDDKLRRVETKDLQDILTLINELESENERLLNEKWDCQDDLDNYHEENKQLKDRIVELESELEKEQINNLNCDTELQYKEKRIAELEKQVCGNEELHTLVEKLNYMTILKKFAEKVKDSLEEYRLENEYFTEHEPNGNLWQMNASVFCIEVTQDGGLIDQLAKECLNEFAKDLKINYGKI